MTYRINEKGLGPSRGGMLLVLLVPTLLAGALPGSAAAQPADSSDAIRITVIGDELGDARSLAEIRRQVAIAAREVCGRGGLASIYRNGARRCRARAVADAERQIEEGRSSLLARLADRR